MHARHLFEDNADLDQTLRVDMIIFLSLISSQIKIYIYGHINNLLIELSSSDMLLCRVCACQAPV